MQFLIVWIHWIADVDIKRKKPYPNHANWYKCSTMWHAENLIKNQYQPNTNWWCRDFPPFATPRFVNESKWIHCKGTKFIGTPNHKLGIGNRKSSLKDLELTRLIIDLKNNEFISKGHDEMSVKNMALIIKRVQSRLVESLHTPSPHLVKVRGKILDINIHTSLHIIFCKIQPNKKHKGKK